MFVHLHQFGPVIRQHHAPNTSEIHALPYLNDALVKIIFMAFMHKKMYFILFLDPQTKDVGFRPVCPRTSKLGTT